MKYKICMININTIIFIVYVVICVGVFLIHTKTGWQSYSSHSPGCSHFCQNGIHYLCTSVVNSTGIPWDSLSYEAKRQVEMWTYVHWNVLKKGSRIKSWAVSQLSDYEKKQLVGVGLLRSIDQLSNNRDAQNSLIVVSNKLNTLL